jgi:1,2-diacylglycerol 3-alpha-glucosyltransferase
MRIAYLSQSYPPMISGAAFFARDLAEAMARRGHQVLVIAASDKKHPYLDQKENLAVLRLRSFFNPMRVGQRFLPYPRRGVMKALREFQPDVIHMHEPLQMGLLGLEYAKRAKIPTTLTLHQLPWFVASYLPERIRPFVEAILWTYARWLLKQFTSIIAPTQTISTIVSQMTGLDTNVIGYGLDLDTFHPPLTPDRESAARQKRNLPPDTPLMLHVGRLDTDKRVDRVILAAAQVMRESAAHLIVVGDGQQKNYLIQLCRNLGIAERVHFTGFVLAGQGLPEIYRMADLFVTASEIETQGIVLLEAAASGLPLVAVCATCIPEIVHHEVNGYLAEPGDIHALAASISKILDNPRLASAMGKQSRTLAEKHDAQIKLEKHENLYQHLSQGLFPAGQLLNLKAGKPVSPFNHLDTLNVKRFKADGWKEE